MPKAEFTVVQQTDGKSHHLPFTITHKFQKPPVAVYYFTRCINWYKMDRGSCLDIVQTPHATAEPAPLTHCRRLLEWKISYPLGVNHSWAEEEVMCNVPSQNSSRTVKKTLISAL